MRTRFRQSVGTIGGLILGSVLTVVGLTLLQGDAGAQVAVSLTRSLGFASSRNVLLDDGGVSISGGFGTGAAVTAHNGSAWFTVNVGTGETASSGSVNTTNQPLIICHVEDMNATPGAITRVTDLGSGVTVTNLDITDGVTEVPWNANEILYFTCMANGYD